MGKADAAPVSIELHEQPGHLIRRAHQIAVSLFHENLGREVTPVQYAVLRALQDRPGIDQVTLAQEIALDTSSTADVAVRLEAKGLIVTRRNSSACCRSSSTSTTTAGPLRAAEVGQPDAEDAKKYSEGIELKLP